MKTTRCKCCGMPIPAPTPTPTQSNYTTLPTRCRVCSHIARQSVRASIRRVDAMRKETTMLGINR